ncbi:MAG: TonB-dependent receptor [Rhodothermaceae bacterium]|nr:TonB-dependent receptor [Rhodothermaceae bacterium]
MKTLLLFLSFTLFPFVAPFSSAIAYQVSQEASGTIEGIIRDADTDLPLPGVNVQLNGTFLGTSTNDEGFFRLPNVPANTYSLSISMIGYGRTQIDNIVVQAGQTTPIEDVHLTQEHFSLSEITVTPGRFSIMGGQNVSRQTLTSEQIKNMTWADDVTRAVTRLPGISSTDFSSKFTIRGGESDEVLIAVDGMELYEPFHQRDFAGGLFSIVDIETIEGIDLITGGFSAEYGNRLSGVFNMKTKSIDAGERNTSVGLSLTTARFYTDGSFGNGRGSYILSARRGMLDLLFNVASTLEESTIDQSSLPQFYDALGKLEYAITPKHRLSLHLIQAGDRNKIDDVEGENFDRNDNRYSNTYGWLTLNSSYSPSVHSSSYLYSGLITHNRSGGFNKYEPSDKGFFNLTDKRDYAYIGFKQDWNWQISNALIISSGFDAKQLQADYHYTSQIEELRINQSEEIVDFVLNREISVKPSGQQLNAYVSNRFKIRPRIALELGLRYDRSTYSNDDVISPRLGIAYAISEHTIVRGAWGYYYQSQFINNLDVNHGSLVFNPAELAKHYVVGFEHAFLNGIELRLEGYHKDLSNYVPSWTNLRDSQEVFPEARNDNARVILNGASAQGIEFFLKRDTGDKLSWWLSYALANSVDDVEDIIFDGLLTKRTGKVTRLQNQRHSVYADLNYKLTSGWYFNLSWQFYYGWPRTDYTYDYQTLPNGDLHFYQIHKEYNGTTYPAFHRMDVRINRKFNARRGNITAYLHLINLYNRQNLKKFDLDTTNDQEEFSLDAQGNYVPFRDDKYWFGFFPALGASWTF